MSAIPSEIDPLRAISSGDRPRVYVHPGHSFHATEPTAITTILGSCVSVCFYDELARFGGITHYVLPRPLPGSGMAPGKIGAPAITQLFESLVAAGAHPRRMKAKVFGGASMQPAFAAYNRDLGGQNVAVAFDILAQLEIAIIGHDTGGSRGRKLLFHNDDGAAWIKYLGESR